MFLELYLLLFNWNNYSVAPVPLLRAQPVYTGAKDNERL